MSIDTDELVAMQRRHLPRDHSDGTLSCAGCHYDWPCDAARLLADGLRLRRLLDASVEIQILPAGDAGHGEEAAP